MRLPPLLFGLICLFASGALLRAEDSAVGDQPRPKKGVVTLLKDSVSGAADGLNHAGKSVASGVSRIFSAATRAFGLSDAERKKIAAQIKLQITPGVINLDQHRTVEVILKVSNPGKRALLLEFPTSQRADAVIRDAADQIVARAAEDQDFIEESSIVSLNPGERVEYAVSLPTRGLKPGQRYKLEAALVNQKNLRTTEFIHTK